MRKTITSVHEWPSVMDAHQAAAILGKTPRCVTNEINQGNLVGKKIGKGWSITKYHLCEYLNMPPEVPSITYDVVSHASQRVLRACMNAIPKGKLNEPWLAHLTVNEVMRQLTIYGEMVPDE